MQDLIRKYNLFPEMPPYAGDTWPWPVKIYVLGKFELVLDGKPLSFTGKMPKRPLLLLKMLIALGGEGVREEQLTDLLWPEADGDRAHSVFTTTLSRLRRLIGFAEAIEIHSGKVSIN
ncbi:MAG TPA: AAA family ATPase, partial [Geobacteraceae bacterium]|nr:AAA family ATPase [Geobacteraceae bacterium]